MKKNLQHGLLAAALVVAGATSAQAQVTFGPRVGLNVSKVSLDYKDNSADDVDPKFILGPQVGLTLNAQFGNLSIQPSVLFSQKGYKAEQSETFAGTTETFKYTQRMSYAEIPVNFVYTTGGTEGFQIFAGPYAAFGIGGKAKLEYSDGTNSDSEEVDIKFESKNGNGNNVYVRGLDFGLNAGVGYKAGPIQAQLGYGLGLSNLIPNSSDDKEPEDKEKNRVIHLSLSYFFGE
ncbi:PorT family protein [Hymenobacter aquaticus]|uniref:PorT family protein n=1 Tax=Hymenobacter aquaticus TaxID=1867101 RepID=A0A4Z0PYV9_9BACT|nr:porin family protein [Hymenobacter aquaticus]TGE22093.1 PorT family protein [Hymenobacter aquaticus]